jgi:hypothetical protein
MNKRTKKHTVLHPCRSTTTVARWSGVSASGIWSNAQTLPVKLKHRATARSHRVDLHHRRSHAHACNLCLERSLVLAFIVRNVGRRASHVKGNDLVEASDCRCPRGCDDSSCRPGKDGVTALEKRRCLEKENENGYD